MRRTKPTPLASRPVKSFAATARVRHGMLKLSTTSSLVNSRAAVTSTPRSDATGNAFCAPQRLPSLYAWRTVSTTAEDAAPRSLYARPPTLR